MIILPPQISKPIIELTPLLTTAIIAPHGMTDLIYAEENNSLQPLLRINAFCIAGAFLIHMMNFDDINNMLFMTSSALHFRHDFPIKNSSIQLLISSLLVANAQNIGIEIFMLYMCLIHVPNHYTIYKNLIAKYPVKSLYYISIVGILSTLFVYSDPSFMYNDNVHTISKGLIISHILYEELYTKNNTLFQNITKIFISK